MHTVIETPSAPDAEALRTTHQVRLVTSKEEGSGVNALPPGVYGFTYSPGLPNTPLFAQRRYRTYETHKVASGDVFLIGFAMPQDAAQLANATTDVTIRVRPQPEDGHTALVTIAYSRIRRHRQYAAPNQDGFTVTLAPA